MARRLSDAEAAAMRRADRPFVYNPPSWTAPHKIGPRTVNDATLAAELSIVGLIIGITLLGIIIACPVLLIPIAGLWLLSSK